MPRGPQKAAAASDCAGGKGGLKGVCFFHLLAQSLLSCDLSMWASGGIVHQFGKQLAGHTSHFTCITLTVFFVAMPRTTQKEERAIKWRAVGARVAACKEAVPAFDTVDQAAEGYECELAVFPQEAGGRIACTPPCIERAQGS